MGSIIGHRIDYTEWGRSSEYLAKINPGPPPPPPPAPEEFCSRQEVTFLLSLFFLFIISALNPEYHDA